MIIQSYNNNQTTFNGRCKVTQIINKNGKLVEKIKTIRTSDDTDFEIILEAIRLRFNSRSTAGSDILVREENASELISYFENFVGRKALPLISFFKKNSEIIKFKKNNNKLLTATSNRIMLKDVGNAEGCVTYDLTEGKRGKDAFKSNIKSCKNIWIEVAEEKALLSQSQASKSYLDEIIHSSSDL